MKIKLNNITIIFKHNITFVRDFILIVKNIRRRYILKYIFTSFCFDRYYKTTLPHHHRTTPVTQTTFKSYFIIIG